MKECRAKRYLSMEKSRVSQAKIGVKQVQGEYKEDTYKIEID